MKQVVKKSPNRSLSLVFWLVCILLVASFALFVLEKTGVTNFYNKPASPQESTLSGPTDEIDYPISTNTSTDSPYSKQSGTDQPITSDTLSGVVNYKAIVGDMLSIRVTIYQILSSGSCSLTLTRANDSKQFTKTVSIAANPSSATCQGFDVPTSELGTGEWSITVTVTSGDKNGTITDKVSI